MSYRSIDSAAGVALLLARYHLDHEGDEDPEPFEWDDYDETDLEQIWLDLAAYERVAAAAREARDWLKGVMADKLGDDRGRFGDTPYRSKQDHKVTVNRDGLTAWLGDDYAAAVGMAANGANVRKGALTAIANKRDQDPRTIMDTFFESEPKETRSLSGVPVTRAPKYAAKLDHGEIRGAK